MDGYIGMQRDKNLASPCTSAKTGVRSLCIIGTFFPTPNSPQEHYIISTLNRKNS